jgi:hypothetical protein
MRTLTALVILLIVSNIAIAQKPVTQDTTKKKDQKTTVTETQVHITPESSGVKRSIGYKFSSANEDGDPGNGMFRLDIRNVQDARYIIIDDKDISGNDQTKWYSTWDDPSGATGRGRATLADISGKVICVFNFTGVFIDADGFWKLPVEYVSGSSPVEGVVYYYLFDRIANRNDSYVTRNSGQTKPVVKENKEAAVIVSTGVIATTVTSQVTQGGQVTQGNEQKEVKEENQEQKVTHQVTEQKEVTEEKQEQEVTQQVTEQKEVKEEKEVSRETKVSAATEVAVVSKTKPVTQTTQTTQTNPVTHQVTEQTEIKEVKEEQQVTQQGNEQKEVKEEKQVSQETKVIAATEIAVVSRTKPVTQTTQTSQVAQTTQTTQTKPVTQTTQTTQTAQTNPVTQTTQTTQSKPVTQTTQPTQVKPVAQTTQATQTKPATQTTQPVTQTTQPAQQTQPAPAKQYNQFPVVDNIFQSGGTGSGHRKWYRGIIEIGYGFGIGDYGINNFRFNFINAIRIGQFSSIGLGLGYRRLFAENSSAPYLVSSIDQIPVFLDLRTSFSTRKLTPYVALGIGASSGYRTAGTDKQLFLFNGSGGIWYNVSPRLAVFAGIGYEMQKLDFSDTDPFTLTYGKSSSSISLNIGISF